MRAFKRVKMLNADDYRVLKKTVASRKMAAGEARRAKIVLLSNQGYTAREIAERLGCNERTALKWIGRFNSYGRCRRSRRGAPGVRSHFPLPSSRNS